MKYEYKKWAKEKVGHWFTGEVIASRFPINVIEILITSLMWGFFEGFNYKEPLSNGIN